VHGQQGMKVRIERHHDPPGRSGVFQNHDVRRGRVRDLGQMEGIDPFIAKQAAERLGKPSSNRIFIAFSR
jgi:hypothetical protein